MTDLSRRDGIKLIGAASIAAVAAPGALQAAGKPPSAHVLALRDRVQQVVDDFDLEKALSINQYSRVFRTSPSLVENGQQAVLRMRLFGDDAPRAVFNVAHDEHSLGFAISPTAANPIGDTKLMLLKLVDSFMQLREIQAADIFNGALTYDATVIGDGMALCSASHPLDGGVWSNLLPDAELNVETLKQALQHVWVDESNLRIGLTGRLLVVPPVLMPLATRAVDGLDRAAFPAFEGFIVWDYLTSHSNWFVLTDCQQLIHSVWRPLTFTVSIDEVTDYILVAGSEKGGFGCFDPRSVLGAMRMDEMPRRVLPELKQRWQA